MFHDGILRIIGSALLTGGLLLAPTTAGRAEAQPTNTSDRTGVTVTLYPLLVRAPIFGAKIELPAIPGGGGGNGSGSGEDGSQSGTTDAALNAAYMAGILVQADRWFGEFNGLYAALSATHDLPFIDIDSKTYFYNGRGGVRLFDGISATAGFRRITIDLDATLDAAPVGRIQGRLKPGFWDPLIGVDWRRSFGKWSFDANVEGGGFGGGTDTDLGAEVNAKRHFGRHVELRFGYEMVYLKFTVLDARIGAFERKLTSEQTLHGPQIGIGIVF